MTDQTPEDPKQPTQEELEQHHSRCKKIEALAMVVCDQDAGLAALELINCAVNMAARAAPTAGVFLSNMELLGKHLVICQTSALNITPMATLRR